MESVAVIGAALDLGAGRRGVDMGPSAIRYAGLADRLASLESVGDLGKRLIVSGTRKTESRVRREAEGRLVSPKGIEAGGNSRGMFRSISCAPWAKTCRTMAAPIATRNRTGRRGCGKDGVRLVSPPCRIAAAGHPPLRYVFGRA